MLDPDDDAAGVAARRSGIGRFLNCLTVRSEPRTTTIPAEGMRDPFSANRCKSKAGVCKSKSTAGMATYLRGNKLPCLRARMPVRGVGGANFGRRAKVRSRSPRTRRSRGAPLGEGYEAKGHW